MGISHTVSLAIDLYFPSHDQPVTYRMSVRRNDQVPWHYLADTTETHYQVLLSNPHGRRDIWIETIGADGHAIENDIITVSG